MHPLFDNLKSLSYEELEKKNSEIQKRLMMIRTKSGPHIEDMWNQLVSMLDAIQQEKLERLQNQQNQETPTETGGVVLNTDPLEEEIDLKKSSKTNKPFKPFS
jgi:hypothetical protein